MSFWDRPAARRLQSWIAAGFWMLLFVYTVWPWTPWQKSRPRPIVFFGFSILGEALNLEILPAFQEEWEQTAGEHLEFATSFAGSGTMTNQLIMGVPAQLALLSSELDAERLAAAGLIQPGSWKRLPHDGVVDRTPFVILVRSGNPKQIHSFSDLARPGVKIVHPDPLTSGAANWAILAEYGAGLRLNPSGSGGYLMLLGIWRNVVAQAQSARAARTQFENGFGDALITYEQEALWDRSRGTLHSDIVYPPATVMSEHTLVIIDRNISPAQRPVINALVKFLWSDRGQSLFIKAGFRSVDERLNRLQPEFEKIEDPILVNALGGWNRAKQDIIDSIWRDRVLKEVGQKP